MCVSSVLYVTFIVFIHSFCDLNVLVFLLFLGFFVIIPRKRWFVSKIKILLRAVTKIQKLLSLFPILLRNLLREKSFYVSSSTFFSSQDCCCLRLVSQETLMTKPTLPSETPVVYTKEINLLVFLLVFFVFFPVDTNVSESVSVYEVSRSKEIYSILS